ncbi:MAG: hypothetical protein HYU56_03560 [Candidatus Aenigmarchaeota archaeon]|nr:hypothetical protein [Candidatus Aenigmarchaeota archaeon]
MTKSVLYSLLIIASLFVSITHAQFEWAEDLSERFDDFFSDFGRPNCAHEGEIADKTCCSGLHEQYNGYLGETICTEYRETQTNQQPTQQPYEANYPEPEAVCYDDDYCQYVKGEGWKCDLASNRCYSDGTSPLDYSQGEQIGQTLTGSETTTENQVIVADYIPTSETLRKLSCTNKECGEKFGLHSICDTQKSFCKSFIGVDEKSFCSSDDECVNKYIYGWICQNNKCRNDIYVKTGKYNCFPNSIFYGNYYCKKTFGQDYFCETESKICINKYTPSADIVFVPLNYNTGDDMDFISVANSNLMYFEKITGQQCNFKTAYIPAGKCTVKCNSSCCIAQAQHCAVENGYIFAKRIVGIIKTGYTISQTGGGCALEPGNVLTVQSNSKDVVFSHEIGHNFNFCHVFVDSADTPPFTRCQTPGYLCNAKCSNVPDCNLPINDRVRDVMSYCSSAQKFSPAAYNKLVSTCNKLSASAEPTQEVIAAYITVSSDGTATVNSVHVGEAYLDEENDQGNYELVAFDGGRKISSEDFDVQFSLHGDLVDENGQMHSEPVELDEYNAVVQIPYSLDIDEIKIEHNGRVLVAKDLSDIAADGSMFAQTTEGNAQITALPEDIAEKQGIKTTNVAYEEKAGNLVYNVEGKKTELFLGFIPIDEHVTATYDSTGNLLDYYQKPWWQFWG